MKKQSKQLMTYSIPSCIETKNEKELIVYERNLTIDYSIKCKTLRSIKTELNHANILKAVTFLVLRSSKTNAIYKEIEPKVAISLAIDLLEQFDYDSFEDIVLMFKYARLGKLRVNEFSKKKSFYETVLNDWLPIYLDIKAQKREQINLSNKESGVDTGVWSEQSKKAIRELRMDLKKTVDRKNYGSAGNMSEYENELKEAVKNISEVYLQELIRTWKRDNVKKHYVPIFEKELENRV